MRDIPPTLTLPRRGGGETCVAAIYFPSPSSRAQRAQDRGTGEGWGGGDSSISESEYRVPHPRVGERAPTQTEVVS